MPSKRSQEKEKKKIRLGVVEIWCSLLPRQVRVRLCVDKVDKVGKDMGEEVFILN